MAEIMVRGRAEARLAPTSAALTVIVHATSAQQQAAAVEVAAVRCEAVDAAIDARRGPLVRAAVSYSVRTGEEYDYSSGKGRRLVGYFATRSTEVECEPDGEGLTALLHEVPGLPDVRVSGPHWHVAPDADGFDQVRRAAAEDARRRAEAYAGGLGMAVGRVSWVAEPGLRRDGGPGVMESGVLAAASPRALRRGGEGDGDTEPTLVRVIPEPIRVEVSVEVGFDLT